MYRLFDDALRRGISCLKYLCASLRDLLTICMCLHVCALKKGTFYDYLIPFILLACSLIRARTTNKREH